MTRVAVLDDYLHGARGWADWGSLGDDVQVTFLAEPLRGDALVEALTDVEVLVLMRERTRFPREILERLPALALVITTGMGNASLDVTYLAQHGVVVCGTEYDPGGPGVPGTAEVAWALILATAKRVTTENAALRSGRWQTGMPTILSGATLGLLGVGNLGSTMVGPARAFGMDVIGWSENLTAQRAREAGVALVSREELFARSDWLSIHLRLSPRTRGLIGAAELAAMKSTATLINTSRGPIVDTGALVAALRDHTIASAGLDVYDTEPLPADDPLLACDNAVLLPHLGYVSETAMRVMYGQVVQDIAAWRDGAAIRRIDGR